MGNLVYLHDPDLGNCPPLCDGLRRNAGGDCTINPRRYFQSQVYEAHDGLSLHDIRCLWALPILRQLLVSPRTRTPFWKNLTKYSSIELVLGISPFLTAFWFGPWAAGGIFLASVSSQLLHLVPGRWLLIMCGTSNIIAVLLFALMPANPSYWAWVFPAMVAETTCIDVVYTVTNVFITTNLPSHRQGLAGALINCTLFLGIALFLGVADVAVEKAAPLGLAGSYKVAFWIGVGFAVVCLLISATMNIGSAKSDLTRDEKILLEGIASQSTLKVEAGVDKVAGP